MHAYDSIDTRLHISNERPWLGAMTKRLSKREAAEDFVVEAEVRGIALDRELLGRVAAGSHRKAAKHATRLLTAGERLHPIYRAHPNSGRITAAPNLELLDGRVSPALVPDEGHRFVTVSPSQLELTALAALSKDSQLLECLEQRDPMVAAAAALDCSPADAKVLLYSAVYGKLSQASGRVQHPSFEELAASFATQFPDLAALVSFTERNKELAMRVLRLASLAAAEAAGAAHAAAVARRDTFAAALVLGDATFSCPSEVAEEVSFELSKVFDKALAKRYPVTPRTSSTHITNHLP